MRWIGVLIVGLVLGACDDPRIRDQDHVYRDAKTGQVVTCSGGWQSGLIGMTQKQEQGSCDDRMWSQGYERLPLGTKPDAVVAPKS